MRIYHLEDVVTDFVKLHKLGFIDTTAAVSAYLAQREPPGAPGAGSNRSPREHLRRGHIRRISEDRTVWVNATVVAAGSAGQLSKSYMVRNPA